jgi:thioredoxin-related protein
MRLEKNILNTKKFQDYLAKNYLLLLIEFPHHRELNSNQRKHNKKIFKKYGLSGVPTILILNGDGKIIGKTGTAKDSKTLIARIAASRVAYKRKLKK